MTDETTTPAPLNPEAQAQVDNMQIENLDAFGLTPETNSMMVCETLFGMYWPKFKAGVLTLSSKQRARLLLALIEYPIHEREYKHDQKVEQNLFNVGMRLLEAKYLMIIETYAKHAAELQAAAAKTSNNTEAQETPSANEGDKTNG